MKAALMAVLFACLGFAAFVTPAGAVNPDEILADPQLEARARSISENLRCLVCQNQSIDLSDADLARELRLIVRERLSAGDTDPEVFKYVVDRYGEFVLLHPVVAPHTLLLWAAGPAILLIGGLVLFIGARRKRHAAEPGMLSAEEAEVLETLNQARD